MTDFEDITFDELPRQYVRRIKETLIVAYTVERGTPDAIVYNIFQRINTGGLECRKGDGADTEAGEKRNFFRGNAVQYRDGENDGSGICKSFYCVYGT